MGNQLSLQLASLEYYLNDLEEKYTIEKTIGFGKFVKTLQCVPSADSPFALSNILDENDDVDDDDDDDFHKVTICVFMCCCFSSNLPLLLAF
jgi:hypothetical protein